MKRFINTAFEDPETKEISYVTEQVFNDALTYLTAHNKVSSYRLTVKISKAILNGVITQDDINKAYQVVKNRELQEKLKVTRNNQQKSKLKNIDEYITYMNEQHIQEEREI